MRRDSSREADAANYGISDASIAALEAEYSDYEGIINAPDVAQNIRKALTKGFRPAFNLVEKNIHAARLPQHPVRRDARWSANGCGADCRAHTKG